MRRCALAAAAAVLISLAIVACGKSQTAEASRGQQQRAIPVGVAPVEQRDVPILLQGLGTVTAYNTVTVRSRVDGEIVQVNFREGQDVKKGDLLVVVDPRPFEVALSQAQATLVRDQGQYNTARLNAERDQTLAKQGIVAQQQADQSRALYEQYQGSIDMDKSAIQNAKLNLVYTRITAPITGRVGLRLVDPGNIVHANDTNGMLTITQMEPIAIIFTLPEDNLQTVLSRMRQGVLPVDAFSRDDRTKIAGGKLETIDNQIDPTTGTVKLKAVFDNKERALWPNQFVNVHLQLETRKDAIVVPASAVQRGPQNNTFVYAVGSDNTAQVRNIQVALTQGNISLISQGVQPGDRVVTDGQEKLQAGMKVDPQAPQRNASGQGAGAPGGGGILNGAPPMGSTPGSASQSSGTPPSSGAQGPSSMPPPARPQGNQPNQGSSGVRR